MRSKRKTRRIRGGSFESQKDKKKAALLLKQLSDKKDAEIKKYKQKSKDNLQLWEMCDKRRKFVDKTAVNDRKAARKLQGEKDAEIKKYKQQSKDNMQLWEMCDKRRKLVDKTAVNDRKTARKLHGEKDVEIKKCKEQIKKCQQELKKCQLLKRKQRYILDLYDPENVIDRVRDD